MNTDSWVIPLTGVASNGVVTQLYPAKCTAGVNPVGALNAQQIRRPYEGALHSLQLKPDGANAGTLELYDINGLELGADVSSGTAISDAVLTTAIASGKAFKIFDQSYPAGVGSGVMNAPGIGRGFSKGLAARLVSAGTATLNLVCSGGYGKTESRGP